MKLYLTPGACSLAAHIALQEAGLVFDRIRVDLETKRTEDGSDYTKINPKGYVPALVLDDEQLLTENVAILSWVADRRPEARAGRRAGAHAADRNARLHRDRAAQAVRSLLLPHERRREAGRRRRDP